MADVHTPAVEELSDAVTGLHKLCHSVTEKEKYEIGYSGGIPPRLPPRPERTGIPPAAWVAGRRAAVTGARRRGPRADKILKTRHLNLGAARPGKAPLPQPATVHARPGRDVAAAERRRGPGGGRGRDLPFEFPNIAGSAGCSRAPPRCSCRRAGRGAGRAPGMRGLRNKWAPRRRPGEGSGGSEGRVLGGDAVPRPGAAELSGERGAEKGRGGAGGARRGGGGAQAQAAARGTPALGLRAAPRM